MTISEFVTEQYQNLPFYTSISEFHYKLRDIIHQLIKIYNLFIVDCFLTKEQIFEYQVLMKDGFTLIHHLILEYKMNDIIFDQILDTHFLILDILQEVYEQQEQYEICENIKKYKQ